MTFVVEQNVFNGHLVFTYRSDEFITFNLEHAWVVCALHDQHRPDDIARMKKRRYPAMTLRVSGWVSHFVVKRVAKGSPPGRDTLKRANPVRDSEDVYPDFEDLRVKGEGRGGHVAAITPSDDSDSLWINPRL